MKRTKTSNADASASDELRPEYDFDYRNARPNRFSDRIKRDRIMITLDPDVSEVFTTAEAVNTILRALISAMPQPAKELQTRR
jgi:hypothetical protein